MPKPAHIDDDAWRRMLAYGGDPYIPRTLSIKVLSEWGSEEWSLADFQTKLQAAIDSIPPEFRSTAKVEFEGGGGDESGSFQIMYTRPENAEEMKANAQRYLEYAQAGQRAERQQYERLKAKFEPKSS